MKQRKPSNNNYFSKNTQKFGDNFLDFKTAKQIEYDAPIIFRELAKSNIDLNKDGFRFLHPTFLANLIKAAYDNYIFYTVSYNGVTYMINGYSCNNIPITEEMVRVVNEHNIKSQAYGIILHYLKLLNDSKDLKNLYCLSQALSNFRHKI